jgi:hypothetical protein
MNPLPALLHSSTRLQTYYRFASLPINQTVIMHALLFMPILAMDNPATTSAAVVIVILSVAAIIRSKMP